MRTRFVRVRDGEHCGSDSLSLRGYGKGVCRRLRCSTIVLRQPYTSLWCAFVSHEGTVSELVHCKENGGEGGTPCRYMTYEG